MASSGLMAEIRRAAVAVRGATALIVTAGAGMGVDSGLPEGLWRAYPPLKDKAAGSQVVLLRRHYRKLSTLLKWCDRMPHGYFVFTSNVDGHFQKAGFPEERVEECHGSINFQQCCDVTKHPAAIWPVESGTTYDVDMATLRLTSPLPRGPPHVSPNSLARPNILMFGDYGWIEDRNNAQVERHDAFLRDLRTEQSARLVVVEIGAGLYVPTVRMRSEDLARSHHGTLIRINPREPEVPRDQDVSLPMRGLEALNLIDEELNN